MLVLQTPTLGSLAGICDIWGLWGLELFGACGRDDWLHGMVFFVILGFSTPCSTMSEHP